MSKSELKEIIGVVIFGIINTVIAFAITNFLGLSAVKAIILIIIKNKKIA